MVGRISFHDFRGCAEKRDGRYEDLWGMSLPVFGIGRINDKFHIAGIWQVVTETLKRG